MSKEPDNLVPKILREIRATQDEQSELLKSNSEEFKALNKRLDGLSSLVIHALGQSTATQFRQTEQESPINALFEKLEKHLTESPT